MTNDSDNDNEGASLKHQLRNEEAKTRALKTMLARAADKLEEIADSDCEVEDQEGARAAAERYRAVVEQDDESKSD